MKSSLQNIQEKTTSKTSSKMNGYHLNKILSLVIFIASIKIAVLVGIIFMPSNLPDFDLSTLVEAIEKETLSKKQPSESELKLLARLEAQKIEVPKKEEVVEPTLEKEETQIFGAQVAHAAENIPPTPSPEAAIPNTSPLIPQIKPMQAPTSVENFQRPDSAIVSDIPSPTIANPYMPTDTLDLKEEELNRREQELKALEEQMQARIGELRGLENEVEEVVGQAQTAGDEKYTHLITMYSSMKPRQAALVLGELDEKVAVKILAGMKAKTAGTILSYMQPERAVVLSELLASFVR